MTDRATDAPVLVTGGGGFIAGHLIQQLLLRGYRVRTSIRPAESVERSSMVNRASDSHTDTHEYLYRLPNATGLLEFFEADLMDKDSWRDAFQDVEYVYHIAGPHVLKPSDPTKVTIAITFSYAEISG